MENEFLRQQHQHELIEISELSQTPFLLLLREDRRIIHANAAFLHLFGISVGMLPMFQHKPWNLLDILFQEQFVGILDCPMRPSFDSSDPEEGVHRLIGLNQMKDQAPFHVNMKVHAFKLFLLTAWYRVEDRPISPSTSANSCFVQTPSLLPSPPPLPTRSIDHKILLDSFEHLRSRISSLDTVLAPYISSSTPALSETVRDVLAQSQAHCVLVKEFYELVYDLAHSPPEEPIHLPTLLKDIIQQNALETQRSIKLQIDPAVPLNLVTFVPRFSRAISLLLEQAVDPTSWLVVSVDSESAQYVHLEFAMRTVPRKHITEHSSMVSIRSAVCTQLVRSMGGIQAERYDASGNQIRFMSLPFLRPSAPPSFGALKLVLYGATPTQLPALLALFSIQLLTPTTMEELAAILEADHGDSLSGFILHSLGAEACAAAVSRIQASPKWDLPLLTYEIEVPLDFRMFTAMIPSPVSQKGLEQVLQVVFSRPSPTPASSQPLRKRERSSSDSSATAVKRQCPPERAANHETHTPRALIVEDNPVNRAIVQSILNTLHIDSDFSDNGPSVIDLYTQSPYKYSIILMDTLIFDLDGFQVTEEIRRHERLNGIPPVIIIAVTGVGSGEDPLPNAPQHARDAGMDDFISKPIDIQDFCVRLKKWLANPRLLRRESLLAADDPSSPQRATPVSPPKSPSLDQADSYDVEQALQSLAELHPTDVDQASQLLQTFRDRGIPLTLQQLSLFSRFPIRSFVLDPPLPWMADRFLAKISSFPVWQSSLEQLDLSLALLVREASLGHLNDLKSLNFVQVPEHSLLPSHLFDSLKISHPNIQFEIL